MAEQQRPVVLLIAPTRDSDSANSSSGLYGADRSGWAGDTVAGMTDTSGPVPTGGSEPAGGVTQFVPRPGVTDLGPGYLDDALLPVVALRDAFASAVGRYGPRALAYGANAGPGPLRDRLAALCARWDDAPYRADNILVTAGTSQILDHLAGTLAAPGDTVLVEAASYDLGCAIFAQHGLRVVRVDCDEAGMCSGALRHAVEQQRAEGRLVAFCYLIPTFHNPTGRVMPLARRRDLVAVAADLRVPVVEDNAYRAVALDGAPVPPSLLSLAMAAPAADWTGVLQVSSFSKWLGPGLRLGWLAATAEVVDRLAAGAMFVSGGGVNHAMALAVSDLLGAASLGTHLAGLRRGLAARRDALAGSLRGHLPEGYRFDAPAGGFFVWLRLPDGVAEDRVVAAAERNGVAVAPGDRFTGGGPPAVRLSFSFHPPEVLSAAGERFAAACPLPAGPPDGRPPTTP